MNFPIDPSTAPQAAPAIWRCDCCAFVLTLVGSLDRWPPHVQDMARGSVICDRRGPSGRHLVLDSKGRRHRLLLKRGDGPAYVISAEGALEVTSAALTAFHFRSDLPVGRARASVLHPTPFQHYRLRQMLAVLDARANDRVSTPSLRHVAATLAGGDAPAERAIEWKTSSRRRQIQRLLAEGLQLVNGGYRDLLNARWPTKVDISR
ncbi:DUF2285 domain-containing protein [Porphyrobacter sp. YT40]|uniref:DUF2285 domain-containing protein n=1 Tax=Porphyrobacter sp. YT40 TaxID=2547601 RepID=UPI0015E8C004|nr:DUF2285 domain-containing protein [Porphyrobacter sp. YT40]